MANSKRLNKPTFTEKDYLELSGAVNEVFAEVENSGLDQDKWIKQNINIADKYMGKLNLALAVQSKEHEVKKGVIAGNQEPTAELCSMFQKEALHANLGLAEDWLRDFSETNDHKDLELASWQLGQCDKLIKAFRPSEIDKELKERFTELQNNCKSLGEKVYKNKSHDL